MKSTRWTACAQTAEDKRELYQRKAVPEYWIVDVDARAFERWRAGAAEPEVLTEITTLRAEATTARSA